MGSEVIHDSLEASAYQPLQGTLANPPASSPLNFVDLSPKIVRLFVTVNMLAPINGPVLATTENMSSEAQESLVSAEGDAAILTAVTKMLEARIPRMAAGLRERGFSQHLSQRRYLDEGTSERANWHAGYVAALKEVLSFIQEGNAEYPITMVADQSSQPHTGQQ